MSRRWLNVLYERLGVLIKINGPSMRNCTRRCQPLLNFSENVLSLSTVFKCLWNGCHHLSQLRAAWSNYKHHKFLIGITPQGSTSFVSQAWGGRVSDFHLTELTMWNIEQSRLFMVIRPWICTIHDSVSHH